MQLTDKTYERLSPDERFRVAIEAFARLDIEEIDRLSDTCGYVTLREHSPAYFGRLRGFHELAMVHGILVREQVIVFMGGLFKFSRAMQASSAETTDDASAEDEAIELVMDAIGHIKAYANAWSEFCAELSIDPQKAHFTWHKQSIEAVASFEADDEFEPDAEVYGEHLKFLRHSWRHRLEHCRAAEGTTKR